MGGKGTQMREKNTGLGKKINPRGAKRRTKCLWSGAGEAYETRKTGTECGDISK